MKTSYGILLILTFLGIAEGADVISVDHFKKMTLLEQAKALDQASPEMKPALENIYLHAYLVNKFGGEEGLRIQKEDQIIKERGMRSVQTFYVILGKR